MPARILDAAEFTLAQLKERGDRAVAEARKAVGRHLRLSRETRELLDEIDRQRQPEQFVHI